MGDGVHVDNTLEPSQTASECLPYCSIMGRIPVVTMRCARLKFWSISGRVRSGQGSGRDGGAVRRLAHLVV